MPIIKSAKKRVKTTRKATVRNSKAKRILRDAFKSYAIKPTSSSHAKAQSALDKAAKKGLVHKNKVARKKRQLAAAAKKAGMKVEKRAVKATKTVVKKVAPTKKPAAKKPTAKKAPAKT